jgi:hypothetical protein
LVVGVELKGAEGANSAPLSKRFFYNQEIKYIFNFYSSRGINLKQGRISTFSTLEK